MKNLKRNFASKDAYMLEAASALHALFVNNLAVFNAFDHNLDFGFAQNWKAKIEEAYTFESENQLKDIQAQKTEERDEWMRLCRLKYKEIKFFAFKTFEKNDKKREEFGTKDYIVSFRKPVEMYVFMDLLYLVALKYKTELIANGLPLASIAEIDTLRINLGESISIRNGYMKAKKEITFLRVTCLNECFAMTRTVMDAASLVFYNDFARKKAFVYWQGKHKKYAH